MSDAKNSYNQADDIAMGNCTCEHVKAYFRKQIPLDHPGVDLGTVIMYQLADDWKVVVCRDRSLRPRILKEMAEW